MNATHEKTYTARTWPNLHGVAGISDHTLEVHFGLYEGYVKNANLLTEELAALRTAGQAKGAEPRFAELVRRLGFEFNGMRLHEFYFDNMTATPQSRPPSGALADAARSCFGDVDAWQKDFAAVGAMRGVGWAITYLDRSSGRISNNWVSLHEVGALAGFVPVLVMDVWEHAFMLDYKPAERAKYIDAFLSNVDWTCVEGRLQQAT